MGLPKPKAEHYLDGEVTDAEREAALKILIEREVTVLRHRAYRDALAEWDWVNGGR